MRKIEDLKKSGQLTSHNSASLYYVEGGKKIPGPNSNLWGNCSGLRGNCSNLWGNCSGLRGDCSAKK